MGADVALLQEARNPPGELAKSVEMGTKPWLSDQYDRWPRVVRLSDRTHVDWFRQVPPAKSTAADEIAVSGIGTIAAAHVIPSGDVESFIAVSIYARWIKPHPLANSNWGTGYADASAHRAISDLSAFIGHIDPVTHRILVAGDLNMFYGSLPGDRLSLADRDRTVFDRALGLEFLGPQYPAGRKATPAPSFMAPESRNVVTYHTSRQNPATANRQLDYVFASRGFHESVAVRALNEVDEWGSSDHCRIEIVVG